MICNVYIKIQNKINIIKMIKYKCMIFKSPQIIYQKKLTYNINFQYRLIKFFTLITANVFQHLSCTYFFQTDPNI